MRTTPAVRAAAVLSFLYGLAAAALGVWLIVALATGRGLRADTHEYLVFRGVTTTIVFALLAGAVFVTEAFLVLRGARGIGVVVVASIVAFGGLIGEVIEAVTGGDAASLGIGAGIIAAAALPAVLLLLPRGPRSALPASPDAEPGITPPGITPPPPP
ncbi:signal transduction histidine kinase [Microbacterium testaceum StLB037]|uniref:Signal transduction histidine kinase n=1 Tax=Microbacterium testaceum (strain StLB037) TaxID=979556 RepID=E8N7W0_MICTS|nr:signal transduction histidine kinase [Microbacterium testaceum StLB037]